MLASLPNHNSDNEDEDHIIAKIERMRREEERRREDAEITEKSMMAFKEKLASFLA
jgi:hypothetical protein